MNYVKTFEEFETNIKTLYHGQKSYKKLINEFTFTENNLIYLTPSKKYAMGYTDTRDINGVYQVKVDTTNFLDLTKYGIEEYTYDQLCEIFNTTLPDYYKNFVDMYRGKVAIWILFWSDNQKHTSGNLYEILNQYDGVILNETKKKSKIIQTSYVLFNNKPILNIIPLFDKI